MTIRFLAFIVFMGISQFSFAGQETGNGGDAVVCRDQETGEIQRANLLDYYEAPQVREPEIPNTVQPDEIRSRVAEILSPIGIVSESLYQQFLAEASDLIDAIEGYLNRREHFAARVNFVHIPLPDIPDAGELILYDNCKIEQLAIHITDPETRAYYKADYAFQGDILEHLNATEIVGIVVHEVLFGYAADVLDHPNSRKSRTLNRYLSVRTDPLSWEQVISLLRAQEYQVIRGPEFDYNLQNLNQTDDGHYSTKILDRKSFDSIPVARPCSIYTAVMNREGELDVAATLSHADNQAIRVGFKVGSIGHLVGWQEDYSYYRGIRFGDFDYSDMFNYVKVIIDQKVDASASKLAKKLLKSKSDGGGGMYVINGIRDEAIWFTVPVQGSESTIKIIVNGGKEDYAVSMHAGIGVTRLGMEESGSSIQTSEYRLSDPEVDDGLNTHRVELKVDLCELP